METLCLNCSHGCGLNGSFGEVEFVFVDLAEVLWEQKTMQPTGAMVTKVSDKRAHCLKSYNYQLKSYWISQNVCFLELLR